MATTADPHGWSEGGTVEAGCLERGTRGVCPRSSGLAVGGAVSRIAAAAGLGGKPGRMFACQVIPRLTIRRLYIS